MRRGRAPYDRALTGVAGELSMRSQEFRVRWAARRHGVQPAALRARLITGQFMEAGMRSWVTAVAAVVLLAGCGTALAGPGSGPVHPVGTSVTEPAHPDSGHSPIGRSCPVRPGWAAITLTDTVPVPVVTVPPGARIVVIVPRWGWGTATDVDVAHGGILREECTVLLPGGGRRTIFLAAGQGRTRVGATVQPASNLFMPAWGGEVIVRGTRD